MRELGERTNPNTEEKIENENEMIISRVHVCYSRRLQRLNVCTKFQLEKKNHRTISTT